MKSIADLNPRSVNSIVDDKDEWAESFSDLEAGGIESFECDFLCIVVKTRKEPYESIVLTLEAIDYQDFSALCYFNATINSTHVRVELNSKFARFYRRIFVDVAESRYRKAEQLMKHFVGLRFYCRVERNVAKGDLYWKVRSINIGKQAEDMDLTSSFGVVKKSVVLKNRKRLNDHLVESVVSEEPISEPTIVSRLEISHARLPYETLEDVYERVLCETF